MRVLVTGAGGMLAQAVLPELEREGHEVLALTRRHADVTRRDALTPPMKSFRPDWIFHLAGYTQVDECESNADHAYLVNAIGSRYVALAAAEGGASLLAISTDYVFDGLGSRPYREFDPVAPRSVYGASKWAGEQAVREVLPRHLIVRTAWLYGQGGANFIDTILRKGRAGERLEVVDDQRGTPTWTQDVAGALVALAAAGHSGTHHVTNSGDCTWFDLAGFVLRTAGVAAQLERVSSASLERAAPRPAFSVLNLQMFEHATGTRMAHWQDAAERYLRTMADAP